MPSQPFFSVVTISYNQAQFLPGCIESIVSQDFHDFEYIVQDPGSSDGSLQILEDFKSRISLCLKVADNGPADGLNLAFGHATGRYFLFVNSDDKLAPGALRKAYQWICSDNQAHHVFSGACRIIDDNDRCIRYAYSDSMKLGRAAHGQCILIQPSTIFSSSSFHAVGGFNSLNLTNWDSELFVDMALMGFQFTRLGLLLSDYRVHAKSITGSGLMKSGHLLYNQRIYEKVTGRSLSRASKVSKLYYWLERKISNPRDTYERMRRGGIYSRASQ